jgi:hypothetical protein
MFDGIDFCDTLWYLKDFNDDCFSVLKSNGCEVFELKKNLGKIGFQ